MLVAGRERRDSYLGAGVLAIQRRPDLAQAPPQPLDGETGYYPDRDCIHTQKRKFLKYPIPCPRQSDLACPFTRRLGRSLDLASSSEGGLFQDWSIDSWQRVVQSEKDERTEDDVSIWTPANFRRSRRGEMKFAQTGSRKRLQ